MRKYRFILLAVVIMLLFVFFIGLKRQAAVVNQSEEIKETDISVASVNDEDESEKEEGNYKEEGEGKEENNRKEADENEKKPKIYRDPDVLEELYNNEIPYEGLITKKYSAEEMEKLEELANRYKYIPLSFAFPYIDVEYPFECLREGNRMNYVLFQGEDGSLLCIFFTKTSQEIIYVERFHEFYSLRNFQMEMHRGISILDDIELDFGELSRILRFENIRSRIVDEGTIIFLLEPQPQNNRSVLYDMMFFPDGEEFPVKFDKKTSFDNVLPEMPSMDNYDYDMVISSDTEEFPESCEKMPSFGDAVPEMLPMDKHISWERTGTREGRDPDILFDLVDNETPYEELITKKYSAEDMERIKNIMDRYKTFSILKAFPYVDMDYPIECVRAADRVNYILYQGEDDSLLCVFFSKRTLEICQVELFYEFYSIEDFEGRLKPMVTYEKEIEAVFGKLERIIPYQIVADRIVKEGTLFFIFEGGRGGFILYDAMLFRDGEKLPDSYDSLPISCPDVPEMLPIDKHIGKEDGRGAKEKQEGKEARDKAEKSEEKPSLVINPDGFTSLYNNETPYEELITQKYSIEELERLGQRLAANTKGKPLLEFFYGDTEYKYECVREAGRVNYILFRGKDGSLLCVFFDKKSFIISQIEQFDKFYSVKDFEDKVQLWVTTKEEIEAVFGELCYYNNYFGDLANRVVKEGTLFFEFETIYDGRVVVKKMYLFRDGETLPDGYEKLPEAAEMVPEMLPMDKDIN